MSEASEDPVLTYQPRVRVQPMSQQGGIILSVLGADKETVLASAPVLPGAVIDLLTGIQQCAGLSMRVSEVSYFHLDGSPFYRVRYENNTSATITPAESEA